MTRGTSVPLLVGRGRLHVTAPRSHHRPVVHRARAMLVAQLPALLVLGAAVAAFGWLAVLLLRKADGLASPAFDQAYFAQLVWNVSRGHGFHSDFNPGDFLGLHFSPLLLVPAALQPFWPDARVLTVLHVTAIALTVPALFLLLRAALAPSRRAAWVAAALAAPLPVWAAMQQVAGAEFHSEVLALPLELLAGWAGLTRRPRLMWLAAGLALLAKEDQAYAVLLVGLLIAARARGRRFAGMRRHGWLLAAAAVAWAVLVLGVIMPAFRNGVAYDVDGYYRWLGGPLGLLHATPEHADAVLRALRRPEGWLMAAGVVASLAGLPLLRPVWLLAIIPPVVANLLSQHLPQPFLTLQYAQMLVVPAVVAGVLGARRALAVAGGATRAVRRRWATSGRGPLRPRPAAQLLATGLAFAALAMPAIAVGVDRAALPPAHRPDSGYWDRPSAFERVRSIARRVPSDAPLALDYGLAAPLAERREIHLFPDVPDAAYVMVDTGAFLTGLLPWRDRETFLAALARSARPVLADDGRFRLLGPLE